MSKTYIQTIFSWFSNEWWTFSTTLVVVVVVESLRVRKKCHTYETTSSNGLIVHNKRVRETDQNNSMMEEKKTNKMLHIVELLSNTAKKNNTCGMLYSLCAQTVFTMNYLVRIDHNCSIDFAAITALLLHRSNNKILFLSIYLYFSVEISILYHFLWCAIASKCSFLLHSQNIFLHHQFLWVSQEMDQKNKEVYSVISDSDGNCNRANGSDGIQWWREWYRILF